MKAKRVLELEARGADLYDDIYEKIYSLFFDISVLEDMVNEKDKRHVVNKELFAFHIMLNKSLDVLSDAKWHIKEVLE